MTTRTRLMSTVIARPWRDGVAADAEAVARDLETLRRILEDV